MLNNNTKSTTFVI